ncbi:MAG: class I SAM-dependent methyltransferase [Elusimicrobiota bacterium]|nr:MAG: class I SAM-dependent methyltransferase [Elusimicrobiota bacterium]
MLEKAEYAGTSHLVATRSLVKYNNYVFRLICRGLNMNGELLEFGPGLGDFLERFKTKGKLIDAVENEPQFQETLRPLARKVVSRLDELPGLYDGIVSVNVLEHIEDDRAILRDLYAKLKPGGYSICTCRPGRSCTGISTRWSITTGDTTGRTWWRK